LPSPRLLSRPLSPESSQLTTRARGTNDKPTHMSIPPNAVRIIPFHYTIVITDGTVGAGFKPARIIAAPVVPRIIAAPIIARNDRRAYCRPNHRRLCSWLLCLPSESPSGYSDYAIGSSQIRYARVKH
ncbi:MAG: hypothetical protein FWD57_05330, partial [Polyangiaceae bacterium]|nr:hypothetical protein [Polyangiaceae bacterium]